MNSVSVSEQQFDRKKIEPRQVKKIHTLISKLKMPDEEYRLMLSDYWVNTCKDLQYAEADVLIKKLEAQALAKGVWSRYSHRGKMRYEDLGKRPGMASPRQLRMIEALWRDVSYTHNPERRKWALRRFIFRIVGVSDMEDIESQHVQKLVNAMEAMRKHNTPLTPLNRGERKVQKHEVQVFRDRANYF